MRNHGIQLDGRSGQRGDRLGELDDVRLCAGRISVGRTVESINVPSGGDERRDEGTHWRRGPPTHARGSVAWAAGLPMPAVRRRRDGVARGAAKGPIPARPRVSEGERKQTDGELGFSAGVTTTASTGWGKFSQAAHGATAFMTSG